MSAEPEEYLVTYHRRIAVTELIEATSKREAIAQVKDQRADSVYEWLEWEVIGDATAHRAVAVAQLPMAEERTA